MTKNIFIVTGEHSGDIHASYVVKELKKLIPNINIAGVGGIEMKKCDVKLIHDHSDMAVLGLDALKKIPHHIKLGKQILNFLKNEFKPDAILLIDYGGFNLRLAKELKKNNYKVLYYISPQIWASREGRAKKIKAYIDKMMVILPFEENFHKKHGINAEYVGHPLKSQLKTAISKEELCNKYELDPSKPVISMFPGSRKIEIKFLLGIFFETAFKIKEKQDNIQFCLAQSGNITTEYLNEYIKLSDPENKLGIKIIKNANSDLLSGSDMLITKSGTVTLEASIYKTPMIICYKSYRLAYYIYLLVKKINWLGLPNIILNKTIIPEFLQYEINTDSMAEMTLTLLNDSDKREEMLKNLDTVNELLTEKVASQRVAEIIKEEITGNE
ncbi:MAG: lipid-A-disaccharide synthase [Vampirovibrionia bacterium]